jgi:mono/diheme cytochrome c family protein
MKASHSVRVLRSSLPLALVAFSAGFCAVFAATPARAAEVVEAKKIFNQRCTACHNYGKGVKVGPDLKGVTTRRERPWLLKFIRSSQTVIKWGDPVAQQLFAQFKQQRMPDWTDLSEQQINGILDWFAANGPEQKEPDERDAKLASAAELETGSALFLGRARLANGGIACASCHTIRGDGGHGGTLGPDLTAAYSRYQDRAMTLFLKHPCFPRSPEGGDYLTPQESYALKSFMRQAGLPSQPPTTAMAVPAPDKKGGATP